MNSGEFEHGTRIAKERVFTVQNKDKIIRWLSVDFAKDPDYTNIPRRYIDCGVQFIPASSPDEIEIRTSSQISDQCQGLSALHEQLCMGDRVASCADVEAMVVEAAPTEEARSEYVAFRRLMFGVLVADSPDNENFARSLAYLEGLR